MHPIIGSPSSDELVDELIDELVDKSLFRASKIQTSRMTILTERATKANPINPYKKEEKADCQVDITCHQQ